MIQRATLNQQPSSSGTVTLALPKATAAGHALIVGVSFWPLDVSSVTDSSGDSFARGLPTSIYHNVSQGVMYSNFYYAKNTVGGAASITLHFSRGTYVVAAVSEVAGLDPSAPLDHSGYRESLSSASPWSSAAVTTTSANEYLFAWAADEWTNPSCSNPTSGWTQTQTTAGATICLLDRTVSTADSYQVSVTPSTAFNYAMELVAFKGASSTPAPAPTPLTISSGSLPGGTIGTAYFANLAATGGVSPYTWSATGLPSGLSMSSTGAISGRPTTAGTQTASLSVKDSRGTTASSSLSLTVASGSASGSITVSISPMVAIVLAGQSQSFTASVTGTTNQAVNWYVSGVQGGNVAVGTISNGVYTAPPCATSSSAVVITAQSAYAPASQATANVTLAVGNSSSPDRYVSTVGNDSNNGSACHPWASIQHAASSGLQPGMTVHVAPGTYNTTVTIQSSASGTSASRIRYLSDQQWGAKIVTSATEVWSNGGAYVDIEGFDVSGNGNTIIGIHSQGASERNIGNRIHDLGWIGCQSGAGIMMGGGAANQSSIANEVYNIGPLPARYPGCNQIHGIYSQESGDTIQNNLIFNAAGMCILADGVRSTLAVVTYNTLFLCRDGINTGNTTGTMPFAASIIAYNIIYNMVDTGIYEDPGSAYGTNQYVGNLINDIPNGSPSGSGNGMVRGTLVGTITGAPMFVSYTGDATGNYHLALGSPAIGGGTSKGAPSTDFNGGARPQGSAWDIGAYEYGAPPATWP